MTLAWRNRDEARFCFKTSDIISPQQHAQWFDRYEKLDNDFVFIAEVDGKSVGQAAIYGIDWSTGTAEIGRFLVAPESAGQGYIQAACAGIIQIGHNLLNLRYLFLEVLETNVRAMHIYQSNGFREEFRTTGLVRMGQKLTPA